MSSERRRQEAYDSIVETTVEILQQPSVQCQLGGSAQLAIDLLQSSFYIPRDHASLDLPEEQLDQNNVGIHPLLSTDAFFPTTWRYLSSPAPVPGQETGPTRSRYHPATWQYPLYPTSALGGAAAVVLGRRKLLRADQKRRDLIVTGQTLPLLPKVAIAAVITHELDHIVKFREDHNVGRDFNSVVSGENKTLAERRAYTVCTAVLEAADVVPPDISLKTIKAAIENEDPKVAAHNLRRFARADSSFQQPPAPADPIVRSLAITSYGIQALSELFQNEDGTVSRNEVAAYRASGVIA